MCKLDVSQCCRLKKKGLWLTEKNLVVLDMHEELCNSAAGVAELLQDDEIVDLADDDELPDDDDGGDAAADASAPSTSKATHARWAVHVSHKLEDLLRPELLRIQDKLPEVWEAILEAGELHMTIAMDNASRRLFDCSSAKYEQGVIKILLPRLNSAQQSPILAIPVFLMEGAFAPPPSTCRCCSRCDRVVCICLAHPTCQPRRYCCAGEENYLTLKVMMEKAMRRLLQKGFSLASADCKPLIRGSQHPAAVAKSLAVVWNVGSDQKLLATLIGHGGASCKCACIYCNWKRGSKSTELLSRTKEMLAAQSELAEEFLEPLAKAHRKVRTCLCGLSHD